MEKPKRKTNRWLLVILGIIAIILLFLLALFALRWINRTVWAKKDLNSRPLVLIHSPLNHEMVEAGEMVTVHATARETSVGLRAVELWVNDVRVAEQQAPDGGIPQSLLLMENWIPTIPGSHVVIVRATAANGVLGQATVVVEVEEGRPGMGIYPVEEGDTLASIADEVGSTSEDLAALNPDLSGGEPAPGDVMDVPGPDYEDEEAGGDGIEDEEFEPGDSEPGGGDDDGAAPDPEEPAPGDSGPFFPDMGADDIGFTGEPVGLRLEVVRLRASPTTERLYCYVHLGLLPTVRYPDVDGDPTTDETFAPLGGDFWDTEPYLVGSPAPEVYWPDEEDLPFEVSCTGVAASGTDALDMGSFDIDIPPANWDGMLRDQTAVGAEGAYFVAYRVSRVTDLRDVPLYQDPEMIAPINVRLDEGSRALLWDYSPRPDEEPVSGFRIYLNGSLQWVEDAEARQTGLPPEWFNPPCGASYTFAVTAYRFDLPDGPESPPGEISAATPAEGCQRQIQINFLTLETFDLGSDGRYEDRTGDVGPPYGNFFANEWQATFDARPISGGGGSLDEPLGLTHNTVYSMGAIASDSAWRFSGAPSSVIGISPGGSFEFGYQIMDHDTGRCHDSDDPGCDDLICDGQSFIYQDSPSGELDRFHEGRLTSENERCRVAYSFGPAPGSPMGSGVPGWEPMPWIDVEEVLIDPDTGMMHISIRNTGTAAWQDHDLQVELLTRSGEPLGMSNFENYTIETRQQAVLHPDILIEPPYDACVLIDPNNLVMEAYEAHGILFHGPVCPLLPDLVIDDVQYDPSGGGKVNVTVRNNGEGRLDNRTLKLQLFLADGSSAHLFRPWGNVSLDPGQSQVFVLDGIDAAVRATLQNGYSVYVDPDWTVPESNEENNTFEIQSGRLKVWWCDSFIPHYYGLGSATHMYLTVDILRGTQVETIFHPMERYNRLTSMETYAYEYNHCYQQGCNFALSCDENSPAFTILGDEALRVTVRADFRAGSYGDYENLGSASQTFTAAQNWGALPAEDESDWGFDNDRRFTVVPGLGMLNPAPWWSEVCILQLP